MKGLILTKNGMGRNTKTSLFLQRNFYMNSFCYVLLRYFVLFCEHLSFFWNRTQVIDLLGIAFTFTNFYFFFGKFQWLYGTQNIFCHVINTAWFNIINRGQLETNALDLHRSNWLLQMFWRGDIIFWNF